MVHIGIATVTHFNRFPLIVTLEFDKIVLKKSSTLATLTNVHIFINGSSTRPSFLVALRCFQVVVVKIVHFCSSNRFQHLGLIESTPRRSKPPAKKTPPLRKQPLLKTMMTTAPPRMTQPTPEAETNCFNSSS